MKKQFIITARRDRSYAPENFVAIVTAKNENEALYSLASNSDEVVICVEDDGPTYSLLSTTLWEVRYKKDRSRLWSDIKSRITTPPDVSIIKIAEMKLEDAYYEELASWGNR